MDDSSTMKKPSNTSLRSFQRDVDATEASAFAAFVAKGPGIATATCRAAYESAPALRAYDLAFENVLHEAVETPPPKDLPAVWLLYNMGLVIKTRHSLFAIDIAHRRGVELAPHLDFALLTHNHDDHWTPDFYEALNRAGKTVVSNFLDNYGACRSGQARGGYTPGRRSRTFADVTVRTALSDHNEYLKNFTLTFEITVGNWTLYHTGDSSNIAKLNPARRPDLWVVHPRCGIDVGEGVRKFHPARTVIGHLCELGHSKWRWTLADGCTEAKKAEAAGSPAIVPLWGDRIQ